MVQQVNDNVMAKRLIEINMPEGAKPGEPMTIDQLENYNKQLLAQLDEE